LNSKRRHFRKAWVEGGYGVDETVTTTVVHEVAPGREADFHAWASAMLRQAESFPGFRGGGVLGPAETGDEWHVVYRWVDQEAARRWEGSSVRARWLARAAAFAQPVEVQRTTGLRAWFEMRGRPATPPPKWKMALVTLAAVFPPVLAFNVTLIPFLRDQSVVLRTLALCVVVTAVVTWVMMPRLQRLLKGWLQPQGAAGAGAVGGGAAPGAAGPGMAGPRRPGDRRGGETSVGRRSRLRDRDRGPWWFGEDAADGQREPRWREPERHARETERRGPEPERRAPEPEYVARGSERRSPESEYGARALERRARQSERHAREPEYGVAEPERRAPEPEYRVREAEYGTRQPKRRASEPERQPRWRSPDREPPRQPGWRGREPERQPRRREREPDEVDGRQRRRSSLREVG